MHLYGEGLHYLAPWHAENVDLTAQIRREMNPDHLLYRKTLTTLARRQDNDDVLFELQDCEFRYAVVHLTWAENALADSRFPRTDFFRDWQDLYENRILVDHQEWDSQ